MKKTLLEIVQEILSDLDSEEVNAIGDSVEALQVAKIVESTYYNLISTREIPELKELIKLTALADSNFPSHFTYPTNVTKVEKVWYDVSDDDSYEYREISWCDPLEFLYRTDKISSDYDSVSDKNAATKYRIQNDKMPEYYTSFDDNYIVMDSYDSTEDSTLQESKTRAYGKLNPTFDISDDAYTPDIDGEYFAYLIAEAKSTAFSVLKGGPDPKIEQQARRQKAYLQGYAHKTNQPKKWTNYGR